MKRLHRRHRRGRLAARGVRGVGSRRPDAVARGRPVAAAGDSDSDAAARCPPTSRRASAGSSASSATCRRSATSTCRARTPASTSRSRSWFARYAFGRDNRVTFVCAPTPTREPLLTTDRADLVISTFTYTADRDTRIDFSRAYYKATGRLLVKNDSPISSSPTSRASGSRRRAARSTTAGCGAASRRRQLDRHATASRTRCWRSTRAAPTRVMCDDTVLVADRGRRPERRS